tara:strand:- start:1452 stop:1670 length:219 start_codon:yes stop_codon:yes gene_type:complete
MDVLNYQRIVLEKKFGKNAKSTTNFKKLLAVITIFIFLVILSLFFLNTDTQVLVKAAPLINDLGINQGDYYG